MFKQRLFLSICLVCLFIASACSTTRNDAASKTEIPDVGKKVRIGFAMDALKQERWEKDRDLFMKRAAELGAEVLLQTADGNDDAQIKQVESLLTQGIDVLVLVPHNAELAGVMVDMAKKQGVPVISYDRLVRNSEPDLYVSFDNERVGELQAGYLFDRLPKGNYLLIGGAPTDNNAALLRKGQLKVLHAAIDRGDIKIVADQWAKEWLAEEALKHTENALTQNDNKIDAVVVSNDGTAGGVIEALKKQNLAGKVLVSGQDAELAALQRILAGTQTMTVYKPISKLAPAAVEAAIKLAKHEKLDTTRVVNNGRIDVRSILIEPLQVDKANLDATVIQDGFQKRGAVYKNEKPQ
jgi:D-xylose transport system substrate-binding protein